MFGCAARQAGRTYIRVEQVGSIYPGKNTNLMIFRLPLPPRLCTPPDAAKTTSTPTQNTIPISLQFLAVVQRHTDQDDFVFSTTSGGHGETDGMASKVEEVFKQMDIRGDGEVSWEDFSTVRLTKSIQTSITYIIYRQIHSVPHW